MVALPYATLPRYKLVKVPTVDEAYAMLEQGLDDGTVVWYAKFTQPNGKACFDATLSDGTHKLYVED